MESSIVTIFKSISWRFIAGATTVSVAWIITGQAEFAATIGLIDTAIKLVLYYAHERAWLRFRLKPARVFRNRTGNHAQ